MATAAEITAFVDKVVTAMGAKLTPEAEEMPDGLRINLTGEDGQVLLRRQGEALTALQHIVAAVSLQARVGIQECIGERLHAEGEFDALGFKAITAPVFRAINLTIEIQSFQLLRTLLKNVATADRLALC